MARITKKIQINLKDWVIDDFTLTAADDVAQAVTLSDTPTAPEKVTLDLPNGTSQINDFDFTVSGNVLSWNGKALETILAENDKLRVSYPI